MGNFFDSDRLDMVRDDFKRFTKNPPPLNPTRVEDHLFMTYRTNGRPQLYNVFIDLIWFQRIVNNCLVYGRCKLRPVLIVVM